MRAKCGRSRGKYEVTSSQEPPLVTDSQHLRNHGLKSHSRRAQTCLEPGVLQRYNLSIPESEGGRSGEQPGLHGKTLPENTNKHNSHKSRKDMREARGVTSNPGDGGVGGGVGTGGCVSTQHWYWQLRSTY